jgi:hypothetical protein
LRFMPSSAYQCMIVGFSVTCRGWGQSHSKSVYYPSSVPLPASACAPPPPAPPPPDVLGPVEVPAFPGAAPGLTAEPGLAARSLVFNKLLKKFCNTSCCVCPVGLGAPPPRLPPLPPSISASARSTAGSEKVDEPRGPTRPAAGGAEGSTGLRKMPRGSRSARRAFSS